METPVELLTTLERPTRRALKMVVSELHSALDNVAMWRSAPFQYAERVCMCFNRAGLIEAAMRRPHHAVALCEAQLVWIGQLADRTRSRTVLLFALQAWLNLARLDRILHRSAADRLELFLAACRSEPVRLGPVVIQRSDWTGLAEKSPGLFRFLYGAWLNETLLGALREGQHDRVRATTERVIADRLLDGFQAVLAEAELMMRRCHATRGGGALQLPDAMSSVHRDIIALRSAEADIASDKVRSAGQAASTLAELARRTLASENDDTRLAILQHVVAALSVVDPESAGAMAVLGCERASAMGDEVSLAWFATVCAENDGCAVWKRKLKQLRDTSWYPACGTIGNVAAVEGITRLSQRLIGMVHHDLPLGQDVA
jgi:hypothetical protein